MRTAYRLVVLFLVAMGVAEVARSALGDLSRLESLATLTGSMFVVGLVGFGFGCLTGHDRPRGARPSAEPGAAADRGRM